MASTAKRAFSAVDGNVSGELQDKKVPAKKAKSTTTKQITKKELKEKLKYASKAELSKLLKSIFADFPQSCKALEYHTPDNLPLTPLPDDPLLKQCFHCSRKDCGLVDYFDVKACTDCCKATFNREEVIDYFNFSKSEANKIKRSTAPGYYGGIKYVYQADNVIKAVKKRDGSLFGFVARHQAHRKTPCTGDELKAASTKAQKNKVINNALKHSSQDDLSFLLEEVLGTVPELKNKDGVMDLFVPSKLPSKPPANDPLLQECFICGSTSEESGSSLMAFHDVKVCTACDLAKGEHGGTLTRDRVMSYFHFSKAEADKISRKTTTGGMYKSKIYVYNVKTVVTAAKKKWGSLYNMMKNN